MWTPEHVSSLIPTLIIEIIVAIALGKLLKNQSRRVKMIPYMVLAVILLVLEVLKQIEELVTGYSLYALPFHFCSLFLYVLPFYAFCKNTETKFYKFIESFTIASFTMLFLFMAVYPDIVVGPDDVLNYFTSFPSFHTITFHYLSCIGFFLIITLKLFPKPLHLKSVFLGMTGYGILEGVLANVLQTNFNGMLTCGVEAIDQIRQIMVSALGWVGQLFYVIIAIIVMNLLGLISYLIFQLISRLMNPVKKLVSKKQMAQ